MGPGFTLNKWQCKQNVLSYLTNCTLLLHWMNNKIFNNIYYNWGLLMMGIYRTFVQDMFHSIIKVAVWGMNSEKVQNCGGRNITPLSLLTQVMTNIKFIAFLLSSAAVINSCSSNLIFPAARKEASKMMVTSFYLYSILLGTVGDSKVYSLCSRKPGIRKDY